MANLLTTQLVNASYAGVHSGVLYTVPAGKLVIVTNLDTWLSNTAANQISYLTIGSLIVLYHVSPAAETINQQWVGKQALTAGQTISQSSQGAVERVAITGYVLAV